MGILLTIYALTGFVILPMVAESMVPDKLSAALHRPVSVGNIACNPFALSLTVENLVVGEPESDDTFVSFDELYVNLQLSSIIKQGPVIEQLRLTHPYARLIRRPDHTFNFSDLMDNNRDEATKAEMDTEPAPADAREKPFRFALHQAQIINGDIVFNDQTVDVTHRFSPLNFELPKLSSFEGDIDIFSQPSLTGRINDTRIAVAVRTKLFTDALETMVDMDINGLFLPHYFPHAPEDIGFEITDGTLDIRASVSIRREPDHEFVIEISDGQAVLADLNLIDSARDPLFSLVGLDVVLATSTPLEKNIHVSSLVVDRPSLNVTRHADGTLNLAALRPKADQDATPPPDSPIDEDSAAASREIETRPSETIQSTEPAPFLIRVDEIRLNNGRGEYTDLAAPSAGDMPMVLKLGDLNLSIDDFSSAPDQSATLDLSGTINDTADIGMTGTFGITPLSAAMNLEVTGISPSWGQPYVPEPIRITIAEGAFLNMTADAQVTSTQDAGYAASVAGSTTLTDFSLIDQDRGTEFLTIRRLSIDGIRADYSPTSIQIKSILLDGFSHQLVRQEDGILNLARIIGGKTEPTVPSDDSEKTPEHETDPKESPKQSTTTSADPDATADASMLPFPVVINEIRLTDLSVNFMDRHITPHFATRLDLNQGSVTGLTSESFEGADLMIQGSIDDQSPMEISGRINPLLADPLIDLACELQNLELSSLSPYSGTYIGNAIEKGKLHFDLVWKIAEKRLQAQNQIQLDQFSLGRKVDSPKAVNLPVGLAVALLKDRNGLINLDIPVSGRTDDPRFSPGKLIIQALTNILTKAATSPFALVGSLVGGGEELRYIEFVHGSAALEKDSQKKLAAVEELLFQRPALNLEMTGYADNEKDRAALAKMALDRELRLMKWAETGKKQEKDSITAEEVTFSEEEYENYLENLYEKRILEHPEAKAEAKSLSDETLTIAEMTDAILSRMTVTDADLRLLIRQRVQAARDHILALGRIDGKRLFSLEAKTLFPEKKTDRFKNARVELGLR